MPDDKLQKDQEGHYASAEEVMAAIGGLLEKSDDTNKIGALLKLGSIANALAKGKGFDNSGEDLLQEAISATLEGRRRWNKAAHPKFFNHLWWAMRSIVSNWRDSITVECAESAEGIERSDVNAAVASRERRSRTTPLYSEDGELLNDIRSAQSTPQRAVEAKLEIERIMQLFAGDAMATDILDGWSAGMTGPEIQTVLGKSKQAYETKVKKIRRTLTSMSNRSNEESGNQIHV
jgi:hypothetical protein